MYSAPPRSFWDQNGLGLGPKFCVEPAFEPPEKIALTRNISRAVPEEERQGFATECVDVLSSTEGTRCKSQPVRECVEFAVSNRLHVMTSDKEDCSVIAPADLFSVRAVEAVRKTCQPIDVKASKEKERAVSLLIATTLSVLQAL